MDADTAPEAGARAEGDTPSSSVSKKKKKKTKEKASVAASEEKREKKRGGKAEKGETPDVSPPRRKSVRINLRKNLVVTIGEKPFPEAVRTPPTSKPRGSALKVKGTGTPSTKRKPRSQRSLKM